MEAVKVQGSVERILRPRSVAVFGASEDRGKFGGRILHYLMKHGFAGRIVPINPNRATVNGIPAYPDIRAVGEPIDVAILAVPQDRIVAALEGCAAAGVGAVIIITTGFAEADEQGARIQDEMVALARASAMRLVGPNCMGLINPHHNLALSSSLVLEVPQLHRGAIGFISQSGALMVAAYNRAHDAGIGFSACVSLGNQADLEICDFFEYLIADPTTRVICMYIEGLKDGPRFRHLALKAAQAGKPVLVVKTGRTEAGVKAARSHTASLAGAYSAFEAVCRDAGVITLDDPDGMLLLADMLVRYGPPKGSGIGVFSPSGGGAGIGVDRIAESGLRLAELRPESKQRLRGLLLPPQADNPIDLGGRLGPDVPGSSDEIIETFTADPDVSASLIMLTTTPRYEAAAVEIGSGFMAAGKPFALAVMPGSAADGVRQELRRIGCPFVDRVDDAVRMLKGYMSLLDRQPAKTTPVRPAGLPSADQHLAGPLLEHEVKDLLQSYGVPVARETFCADRREAVNAAERIGFPVVLKVVAEGLVHKSDIGGVRLNLTSAEAVRAAWDEIEEMIAEHAPDSLFRGGLVSEMVRWRDELIIGVKRDEQFGSMVLVGFGGITVELDPDTVLAPAPVDKAQAEKMLRRLRRFPLLDGYRGRPPADLAAIADAVARVSWLAHDHAGTLLELDINPLVIRASDGKPVAVDARATIAR
ncbi:acetate--CoA ligase family protein [Rhodoligotrophos defluvii]|uniref:acetate--CoA ligase family protein n=1 Tax=Rhodoligotrophos defluvii TaxID=2561934 RepID=UPI0010C9B659|nr:acetate--CoA ligase family protein [Rhodoligotrophos defluvii]